MDHTRRRRAHFDALEDVARCDASFAEFGFLALRLAEILDDFRPYVLVEPDRLKLRLVDLGLGLGDRGDQLAAFAFDSGALALQSREPRQRHQTLVEQLLHAREFARDQLQLLGLGGDLRLEADDLLAKLRYLTREQLLLTLACRHPRPEQRRL